MQIRINNFVFWTEKITTNACNIMDFSSSFSYNDVVYELLVNANEVNDTWMTEMNMYVLDVIEYTTRTYIPAEMQIVFD